MSSFHRELRSEVDVESDRKSVSLGTQPVTLKLFKSQHSMHVFAGSDRPTIIYSNSKKLVYANVNLNEILHVAQLKCGQAFGCTRFS